MTSKYQFYVWEDDLYSIVATASSIEEARKVVLEEVEEWQREEILAALNSEPKISDLPASTYYWFGS